MSYRLFVHRKLDDKLLGVFECNQLKTILESGNPRFKECLGIESYNLDGVKFGFSELKNLEKVAYSVLDEIYSEIHEKKYLLGSAVTLEIYRHIEDEISEILSEKLTDVKFVIFAVGYIYGACELIVSNLYKNPKKYSEIKSFEDEDKFNIPAYEYNSKDLISLGKSGILFDCDSVYFTVETCC